MRMFLCLQATGDVQLYDNQNVGVTGDRAVFDDRKGLSRLADVSEKVLINRLFVCWLAA